MQERSWGRATPLRTFLTQGLALGGLALALVPSAVSAQQPPPAQPPPAPQQPPISEWDDSFYPFARTGVFLGFGGLYALETFDTHPLIEDPMSPLDISADDGGGIELRGGYRATPRFAAEVLFQYYAGFAVKERNSGYNDNFDGWTLTAGGKIYPLLGRIQPYGVAGIGALVFQEKRGDDSAFVGRLGAGLDFYVSDRFVIDGEFAYLFPTGSLSDFQFATFSLGLQYRF